MKRLLILLTLLCFVPPCESRAQCTEEIPCPEVARLNPVMLGGGAPAAPSGPCTGITGWCKTVCATGCDYTDLSDAFAGIPDTGAGDKQMVTIIINSNDADIDESSDETPVTLNLANWTPDASNYVHIKAATGKETNGTLDSGARIVGNESYAAVLDIREPYTRITGIEIHNNAEHGSGITFLNSAGYNLVQNVLLANTHSSSVSTSCFGILPSDGGVQAAATIVKNTIAYNFGYNFKNNEWCYSKFINCTGVDAGIYNFYHSEAARPICINCLAYNGGTANYGLYVAEPETFSWDDTNSRNNAGESGDYVPGSTGEVTAVDSGTFSNYAGKNFLLASDATEVIEDGCGPNVCADVTATDINGTSRSGDTCDIGADEYE